MRWLVMRVGGKYEQLRELYNICTTTASSCRSARRLRFSFFLNTERREHVLR